MDKEIDKTGLFFTVFWVFWLNVRLQLLPHNNLTENKKKTDSRDKPGL